MGRQFELIVFWYPTQMFHTGHSNQSKTPRYGMTFIQELSAMKNLIDFEHWFDQEFERPAKPIFDKLINDKRLSKEEIRTLSHFVFAQYLRTPAHTCD